MTLVIDNALRDRVRLDQFVLDGVRIRERSEELQRAIARRGVELRERYPDPASAAETLAPARRLYRALGIDPTKRRPSSEALLRRIIQGKGLYTVNTAVDSANLTCLHHFLPVGLYDLDRVEPEDGKVTLRLGRAGEEYEGIGKGTIHLVDRPALFDRKGPFGNPSSDSFRTRVTLETKRLLFVLFAPADETPETVARHCRVSREILREFVGGEHEEPR